MCLIDAIMNKKLIAQLTAEPIEPGVAGSPEFCRPADLRPLFGIGRTYTYALLNDGKIRSINLRRRGAKTGLRLIDVASVRQFLMQEASR